ncbi:uncharacterized protein LOC101745475 isoform X1 [Bombyx mori]|uniref:Uncharacterized protein n=2 Tax=Bombyx mori TaxID=7091 RepID=A0A8R2AHH8_BOMMO|nr:uncharacterized protein LOC101745475 [Bombyx mori]
MNSIVKYIFLFAIHTSSSDWVSDWMNPVQNQFEDQQSTPVYDLLKSVMDHDTDLQTSTSVYESYKNDGKIRENNEISTDALKTKLENTIRNSKILAETLKTQIDVITARENALKDAIANGRFGVTLATVSTLGQVPRSYIIRDGRWTLCTSQIQTSAEPLTGPRCTGQEVSVKRDPCAFNSVIKYETIPTQRRLLYVEDDYLCLKTNFKDTLERYLSVTTRILNETCVNGTLRSLADNVLECGIRTLTEYTFYPQGSSSFKLPLEYCAEGDRSCKLIVAWHISNATIENFEFFKNEQEFKNYFMKSGPYFNRIF